MDQRVLAYALQRLTKLQRNEAFDARDPESRPTANQQVVLDDIAKVPHRYVIAGNQCLPEGTQIITPSGLVSIEDLRPGDMVYDENGKEIEVEANFDNGEADVAELTNRGVIWGSSTLNHTWLTVNSSSKKLTEKELTVEEFKRDTQVVRQLVKSPLGKVDEPTSYAIGALLGDGCSRASGILVSSEDTTIPNKLIQLLGGELSSSRHNYNHRLKGANKPAHYDEWCKNRYAHEKTCDLDIIKTWNRSTLLNYVAGLIDTDGSVYVDSWDNLTIRIEMQALPVIESIKYAFLALWQTPVVISVNDREKFVNGPTYSVKIASNAFSIPILRELSTYLVVERKKWKTSYKELVSSRSSGDRIGLKIGQVKRKRVYDIRVKSNRSLYLTATGLVTHNSGKSQLGARETAWVLSETHPKWSRPARWGDESLQLLVVGRTSKQVEEVLWRKISAFLDEGDYKVYRTGGAIQKVTHSNGNTIIFASHHNENEAREKLQAFVAHYVWVDEMPGSHKLLEELHRRIQANKGYFLATFTPKIVNAAIRKLVDASDGNYAKKYQLLMFDNPLYTEEDKERILSSLQSFSKSYQKTILEGDWASSEQAVYFYDPEIMIESPEGYHAGWRHVEAVDPAMSGKFGYTLWAERPSDGVWFCIRADYIENILDPDEAVNEAITRSSGLNICRRVSDPHEVWYTGMANKYHLSYVTPWNKSQRKGELIKNLQTALTSGKVKIAPWCTDLCEELVSCQWKEGVDGKIVNSSSFHLLDCAQYFVDCVPKFEGQTPAKSWHAELREGNRARRAKEAKTKKAKVGKMSKGRIQRRGVWTTGQRGIKYNVV